VLASICYLASRADWQRAALYLLAVTAPLEIYRTAIAKLDVSLFRLSLLVALGVLLVRSRHRLSSLARWIRHPLVLVYLLLAGLTLLALVVHPINTFLGEREAAQIVIGAVALAIVAELVVRESAERAAVAVVAGSTLPILAAGWQAFGPRIGASGALPLLDRLPAAEGLEITRQALSSFGPIGARAKGTFGDPDHFGVYLIFAMCTALALTIVAARRANPREQVTFGAMAVAAGATLLATYSRSAWIGGLLGAVITCIWVARGWRRRELPRPRRRAVVPAVLLVLVVAVGAAPSVIERASPSSEINVVSDREHEGTVRLAAEDLFHHPLLGIGPGGLGVELKLPPRTSGASSTYLSVGAQVGVFGLLALLAAAAITLALVIGAYRSLAGTPLRALALGLAGAYVGFLAANATYDVWFDDFHWVILGTIAGLSTGLGSTSVAGAPAAPAIESAADDRPVGSEAIAEGVGMPSAQGNGSVS
jgi:O-Antigen ligase